MGYNRPEMTDERLDQIRRMIRDNPHWHRTLLSEKLCELWDWKNPNGQIKDISCRDLLRALDAAGKISLPAPLTTSRRGGKDKVVHISHDISPVALPLSQLMPLHIETVESKDGLAVFKSYIDQYHYLGFDRSVGENMKYAVYSSNRTALACLMFGSSAWACLPRDEYIGWDVTQRRSGLHLTTNNSRFLIYPWVRVPHLASHILSCISRRLAGDWLKKYGHPVYLIETFVERARFKGTCYKAANWHHVGSTTGRGRNSTSIRAVLPIKDIWVYPLGKDFKVRLIEG
jgi:hypothetical protein